MGDLWGREQGVHAVREALADAGLRDRTKIMVGGAPVNETFAEQIGADPFHHPDQETHEAQDERQPRSQGEEEAS